MCQYDFTILSIGHCLAIFNVFNDVVWVHYMVMSLPTLMRDKTSFTTTVTICDRDSSQCFAD